MVFGEIFQELQLFRAIPGIQVFFMQPDLHVGQFDLSLEFQVVPVSWKVEYPGIFRDPAGTVEIMITGNDCVTSVYDQIQACRSIPRAAIPVMGGAESGDIAQADQQIISFSLQFFQYFLKIDIVFVDVGYDSQTHVDLLD
jgi:hypothetical protein